MRRARRTAPVNVGIYVLVIVSLQIFLVMVALDAFITYSTAIAWAAAVTSLVLAGVAGAFYRYLRDAVRGQDPAPGRAVRREPR